MFHPSDFISKIEYINRQKEVDISFFLPLVPSIIAVTLALEDQKADYAAVHFLSDRTMRKIHKDS